MPAKPTDHLPIIFSNPLFTLQIKQNHSDTSIKMVMLTNHLNTKTLPNTTKVLNNNLPKIYSHKCFNYLNAPFQREVKKTEIGHLFEHILLEYLSDLKKDPDEKFILEGKTKWDWQTDNVGIFHIKLNIGFSDEVIVYSALEKAISLLKIILKTNSKKAQILQKPQTLTS
ncbi:MAG: hypothetical protein ACD_30C00054G0016 [uncultured bacterium]|uniref:Cyanophycin synthase-like N-terminal domain-containing protein n=4 Tax=Candidatus Daviesiibacteriota TaxID=1752718 RepID=A0A0G0EPU3_9BACT|nr:MAG: hypothetical protein ACD_30C00054G0016 [uncultured bacterium]KKQ07532.1 MAG: hypothetical protein US19_C0043G0003 [Candidatus Daviesbacteria bacterium GW2011_GWB1_36_5]KKQ14842.1 MAG: hypothetical protein US28_C0028G0006 [Candidatus Daviesbacteria bacterium GW2011_GWA1_36_8]OGE16766.1 MAG: hypothetical protein A2858_04055 [Candidatus Daviesbacteria bacterium RIFCSPHIGHO2_01_FULL_36_37]OGE35287.1 MAG: hypothetical protein A3E66_00300 [Candidatus Daviesbacteria bacterium RIFCSPHIGHO2_12_F